MGFTELFLTLIIALVILGPQRLPIVARKVGVMFGKIKLMFNSLQHEVDDQLKLDELQRNIERAKEAEHV